MRDRFTITGAIAAACLIVLHPFLLPGCTSARPTAPAATSSTTPIDAGVVEVQVAINFLVLDPALQQPDSCWNGSILVVNTKVYPIECWDGAPWGGTFFLELPVGVHSARIAYPEYEDYRGFDFKIEVVEQGWPIVFNAELNGSQLEVAQGGRP